MSYISNMSVINLYMLYLLFSKKYILFEDVNISRETFIRYMSNIKFMLDEFHIYHISIYYSRDINGYLLVGNL